MCLMCAHTLWCARTQKATSQLSGNVSRLFVRQKLVSVTPFHFLAKMRKFSKNIDFAKKNTPLLSSNKKCPLFVKEIFFYLVSSKSYRPPQFFAQNESCSFFCIIAQISDNKRGGTKKFSSFGIEFGCCPKILEKSSFRQFLNFF